MQTRKNVWSQWFHSVDSLFFLKSYFSLLFSPTAEKINSWSWSLSSLVQGHRSIPLTSEVSRVTVNSFSVRKMRERECTAARSRSRAPSSYTLAVKGSSASRGSQWERSLSLSRREKGQRSVMVIDDVFMGWIFRLFSTTHTRQKMLIIWFHNKCIQFPSKMVEASLLNIVFLILTLHSVYLHCSLMSWI